MLHRRFAAQFLGGLDEVVDPALLQVRVVDLVDAVGDPVRDDRPGPFVPERAVEGVGLGVDQVELLRGRRVHHFHGQVGRGAQAVFVSRQSQHVRTDGRKGRAGLGRGGVLESHLAGAGSHTPSDRCRNGLPRIEGLDLAVQVGLAAEHHDPVFTGAHARRKVRGLARIEDPPFEDPGGSTAVGVDLELEPGGGDFFKTQAVDLVPGHPEGGLGLHRDKRTAVPVGQAGRHRQTHSLAVVPPVEIHLVGADRPGPFILDPLGAGVAPVAIRAGAAVTRVFVLTGIIEGRHGTVVRHVGGGRLGNHRQIDARPRAGCTHKDRQQASHYRGEGTRSFHGEIAVNFLC